MQYSVLSDQMKRKLKTLITVCLLISVGYLTVFIFFAEGKNSIDFMLYSHDANSCFCSKLFFNVPDSYKENIVTSVMST